MATENFIIDIQFYRHLFQGQILKEIALVSTNEKKIHHWFVSPPLFLNNLRPVGRGLYYGRRFRCEHRKEELTYGETIAKIKEMTSNCKVLYATGFETLRWLITHIPCTVSGKLPHLSEIPNDGQWCSFHSTLGYTAPHCAYNVVSRLLKYVNTKSHLFF